MKIEGTHTLLAPPEAVWHTMLDTQVLLQTVPGITDLQQQTDQTEQSFAITLTLNQKPFTGTYQGSLRIVEQHFPYHYRIAVQGSADQIRVRGEGSLHFQGRAGSTIVAYTGNVHFEAEGQRASTTLARGAAKLLIEQFFTTLDSYLQSHISIEEQSGDSLFVGEKNHYVPSTSIDVQRMGQITILAEATPKDKDLQGFWYRVVHLLRLGDGELELERIWIRRLRRASTISALLLLVWLGTQLPRKRKQASA